MSTADGKASKNVGGNGSAGPSGSGDAGVAVTMQPLAIHATVWLTQALDGMINLGMVKDSVPSADQLALVAEAKKLADECYEAALANRRRYPAIAQEADKYDGTFAPCFPESQTVSTHPVATAVATSVLPASVLAAAGPAVAPAPAAQVTAVAALDTQSPAIAANAAVAEALASYLGVEHIDLTK